MKKKVEVESTQTLLDDFFVVEEAILKHEKYDGSMSESMRRLNFERGDAVAVLLWNTDQEKVLLTEQFRYPVHTKGEDAWVVEATAGMLEEGEDKEAAMRREIEEELGYQCSELKFLYSFFVSPGGSSERIHLFYGEVSDQDQIGEGGGLAQEHEDIRLVAWSKQELRDNLEQGKVTDAKTLVSLLWFLNHHA